MIPPVEKLGVVNVLLDELAQGLPSSTGHLFRSGSLVKTLTSNWGILTADHFHFAAPGDQLLLVQNDGRVQLYYAKGRIDRQRTWRRVKDPEKVKRLQLLLLLQS